MAERSRGLLFRKRNILGAALAAGIGLGIYLGQWGGFGFFGSGKGTGNGQGEGLSETQVNTAAPSYEALEEAKSRAADKVDEEAVPGKGPDVINVVIDEKQFLRLIGKKTTSISLEKLIDLVKQAPGDQDGVRVKIYEKDSARASAEEALKTALKKAEIPADSIFWVPGQFK